MNAIPCRIIRGGTSKGVFFREDSLPQDADQRDAMLLRIMGSPDPRQIDGLGGADPLTSKIAYIGPGTAYGADITYTFGAVGIDRDYVNYSANCGNLTVAAALFAIEEGFVKAAAPSTRVVIYNTNSRKLIHVDVPVGADGQVAMDGTFVNPGVPGTGAEFRVDFAHTVGSTLDSLLPTGLPADILCVAELGQDLRVSIVDIGKICCFFRAEDIGLSGTEGPAELTPDLLSRFWAIRVAAAALLGIPFDRGHLPTPVAVAPPQDSVDFMTGRIIRAEEMTLCARRVVGPPPKLHKAFAGTGAVCTAVASKIPGTVVNGVSRGGEGVCHIGHPSGVFSVQVEVTEGLEVKRASFSRTARTLMVGSAVVDLAALAGESRKLDNQAAA